VGSLEALARECGLDLIGATPAAPHPDFERYRDWAARGLAGEMKYLTDRRGDVRADPRNLLPSAKSVIVAGVLYNSREGPMTEIDDRRAWISRYAWGADYHDVLRERLTKLVAALGEGEHRVCVDTAPLLERSYARSAGLGWIGKNTCLINQRQGSWFFLGCVLTSLELPHAAEPPPDRCGSCTRCIDACPTQAIVPRGDRWELDARLCISYHTIESKQTTPAELREAHGPHVFGCDICQDVCPWNRRAPVTLEPEFQPRAYAPPLAELANLSAEEFRAMFRGTAIWRARYTGFLRNVCTAMGNAPRAAYREPLERLVQHENSAVAEHARWALAKLDQCVPRETF
jgi:epoxyqueuosine reductase